MVLDRDLSFTDQEMTFANPLQGPPTFPPSYPANRNPQDNRGFPGFPVL
jgi:hypothetical protein